MSREQFLAKQEKRRAKRREFRKEIFSALAFIAMSYGMVWITSAIAMMH